MAKEEYNYVHISLQLNIDKDADLIDELFYETKKGERNSKMKFLLRLGMKRKEYNHEVYTMQ